MLTQPSDNTIALTTCELSKSFGGVHAVRKLSIEVPAGQIFGILGPNGSGKTTLFNLISGITKADHGEIEIFGKRVTGLPPHRMAEAGLARTFQNLRLFAGMSVLENVLTGGHRTVPTGFLAAAGHTRRHRESEKALLQRGRELLTKVSLHDQQHQIASQLPYGAARRLEIARALMTQPRLLLLDEPAAGMNPQEAQQLAILIRDIIAMGITVMVIEHNVRLMVTLCDYIVVLDHGEKIAEGTPEAIVQHPAVIEAYLGAPEAVAS
ncbi:MAG: ABC transporter ATP-binding protein [bacterium]|nr:ABC transporter ATP-binding protein [bacterium]